MNTQDKLKALRSEMQKDRIDAYVVTGSDPHQSEYVAPRFKIRDWLSGFSGSAGILVVTKDSAGLWTDSRYYLQAEAELKDTTVQLFRQGRPDVPEPAAWLAEVLPERSVVSYDASCVSIAMHREWNEILSARGIVVQPGNSLADTLWPGRPELPSAPVKPFKHPWVDQSRKEKLEKLMAWLVERGMQFTLISALDEIAWLLNLRGSDVAFNPVFYAYLLVGTHGHTFFVDASRLDQTEHESLYEDGVGFADYESLHGFLQTLSSEDRILLPATTTVMAWLESCSHMKVQTQSSPVPIWKAVKTAAELSALRNCQIRDGAAMVRSLSWIENEIRKNTVIDEHTIALRIEEFRSQGNLYAGQSFDPIVGFAGNGAIVHYRADPAASARITGKGLLLIDTGGQYEDGTTDITRVLAVGGPPAPEEVHAYTLVLKGHIALSTVRFPRGTTGHQLDILARAHLWAEGKNYGHGTGHGIGFYLNVHEGPHRVSPLASSAILEPGMLISNEPGFYETGSFGVRIENMMCVGEDKEYPGFLRFETLSLCPMESLLVDLSLLTVAERAWLNRYHETVRDSLMKELDREEQKWLKEKTKPI